MHLLIFSVDVEQRLRLFTKCNNFARTSRLCAKIWCRKAKISTAKKLSFSLFNSSLASALVVICVTLSKIHCTCEEIMFIFF